MTYWNYRKKKRNFDKKANFNVTFLVKVKQIAYFCREAKSANMITLQDVNKFLEEFKVKAKVFGLVFRDDRTKNTQALFNLGISARIREQIVFSLEGEDYAQGPIFDALNKGAEMWVFGKDYNETELYIKISIQPRHSLVISFHEAEHKLEYPFK